MPTWAPRARGEVVDRAGRELGAQLDGLGGRDVAG